MSRATIGRTVLVLVAAPMVLVLLSICSGLVDVSLSPQARSLYASESTVPVAPSPGFALISGFDSPADANPREVGVRWLEAIRSGAVENGRYPSRPRGLATRASAELVCVPETGDCLAATRGRPIWFEDMASDNAVLLARYRELQAEKDLADGAHAIAYNAPLPPYATVMQTQGVFLTLAAQRASAGDLDAALAMLEADSAFARHWLSQSQLILGKMLAGRALIRDLMLTSQILRSGAQFTAGQRASIARIAAPLDRTEYATAAALRFELGKTAGAIDRIKSARTISTADLMQMDSKALNTDAAYIGNYVYVARYFTARNATLNFMEPADGAWGALDAVDSREIEATVERIRRENREILSPGFAWLYNPVGHWLGRDVISDLSEYVMRLRDVDALARLVCVQAQAKAASIDAGTVDAFLRASDPRCHDPYTGAPFRWDASAGQLWFRPINQRLASDRIGGREGRVAIAIAN